MSGEINVKICGLRSEQAIAAAAEAGARYVGFIFFEKSPRHLTLEDAAKLAVQVPDGVCKVALVVNPTDAFLDDLLSTVAIDMLQLHGSETPARVSEIKVRSGLPVMKAVGVAEAADLSKLDAYAQVADQLLVDAKPPKDGELPGGNGLAFDWRLIAGRRWSVPWMLAGGLDASNVAEALRMTGAQQVDVSSGVETSPGQKNGAKITAFCAAAMRSQAPQIV